LNRLAFLAQFWRSPRAVGAVLPSSRALSTAMVDAIDFGSLTTIVEFGPGTGVMTADIAERLRPTQSYIGIELNAVFFRQLLQRFPHQQFFNESAVNLTDILRRKGISEIDAVLCGLPWASLPISEQEAILGAMLRALRPGGVFVTFAYLQGLLLPGAWALRRRLKANFSAVTTTKIVWRNFPPAFAYVCRR
jgi:phosphatidylethanolamine/phosphatidyl-N-methylethanolamine N-methyltransferase